jgi:methylthioribose-1-phosphate isomerase
VKVNGEPRRTIQLAADGWTVEIIDQTRLPAELALVRLASVAEVARAIRDMLVRGAPLIGAAAGYGMALAARSDPSDEALAAAAALLAAARPTAVNLVWGVDQVRAAIAALAPPARAAAAYRRAAEICEQDVAACRAIGAHGLGLLTRAADARRDRAAPLQVLTHCNAGWLATVDWGTALAPVYRGHHQGLPLHVWVDETRPRQQGLLTAWELGHEGVPHTLVADVAAASLMRRGLVDLVIVGTDRTTAGGDVLNKIGTYPVALAAREHGVPFYVAAPGASIDWTRERGDDVIIEERSPDEVTHLRGVRLAPPGTGARNPAFDVTPARLVTALITERGVCPASRDGLGALYPENVNVKRP